MSRRNRLPELVIDPEFESYVPPLTQEEFDLLEENILCMHRVMEPIIVWEGNIIVDGHNRYRIAKKHPEIIFSTVDLGVDTREEVLDWICRMQLGRRNLTPEKRKYLIGKRYENEKRSHGGDRRSDSFSSSGQNDHLIMTTRARIAQENNVSESYVKRAKEYARGLEILEYYEPGIRNRILNGELKVPEKDVRHLLKSKIGLQSMDAEALLRKIHSGEIGSELIDSEYQSVERAGGDKSKDDHTEKVNVETAFITEMTDALENLVFRWNFALEHPHKSLCDEDLNKLQALFLTGLEFIRETQKKWEEYHGDNSN